MCSIQISVAKWMVRDIKICGYLYLLLHSVSLQVWLLANDKPVNNTSNVISKKATEHKHQM